ncbi:MAG TPA: M17 family peptidase N-terminal domain-containing protein, partial [Sphingomicrobium sp.]|nr:M17 family peptidase N-terminal domain-containing protein [Sphingomicrobium sp.]
MQIRFADRKPSGDYALVVPVAGKDRSALNSLAAAQQSVSAALDRTRFDGEVGTSAEHFFDDQGTTRRLLIIGAGSKAAPAEAAEKIGGSVAAKLQTSGEKTAVIDATALGYDSDSAARIALGAALRSWRYDRYRTKLKDNQKPSLQELVIVGAPPGAAQRYEERWAPVAEGVSLTRELVTEPANIIYPESFVERVRQSV